MRVLVLTLMTAVLAGCATPTVVDVVMPGDTELTCAQLKNEVVRTDTYIQQAKNEKGVTGGNVLRGLVFPIGIFATYSNANEAIQAANQRKMHLASLMQQKNCGSKHQ